MYHYMKTVHARDTRNRLIQGIAGLCVRYYRFPDDEEFGQINPVKSRVPSPSKIFYYKITTNITQNMLGCALICIPRMAKIDDFTR